MHRIFVLALFLGAFAAVAIIGGETPTQERQQPAISVDVELVNILFRLTDKNGKSVGGQNGERFKVFEDGKLQTITNFSTEAQLPLTVALLIDTSGSVRSSLKGEQEAAIEFFYTTLTRGRDRGMAIGFDTDVYPIQNYTDDPSALADSLRKIRAGGSTALNDAVVLAANEKLAGEKGRRFMIIISDGDDTSSHATAMEALEAAQRNDVTIYAISTNSAAFGGEKNGVGDKTLNQFARETGGKVFFPTKLKDLSLNFREITEELRSQYELAYVSTNPLRDGSFRRIRIEHENKRYLVKSRSGYYAAQSAAQFRDR